MNEHLGNEKSRLGIASPYRLEEHYVSTPSIASYTAGVKAGRLPVQPPRIGYPFHALPKELLQAGDLSFGAVCLLAVLLNETGQGRRPFTKSNVYLADEIGRGRSDVGRYLDELEKAGMIRRTFQQPGNVRVGIEVTWTPTRVTEHSAREVTEPSVRPCSPYGRDLTESSGPLKNGEEGGEEIEFAGGCAPLGKESGPALKVFDPSGPEPPRAKPPGSGRFPHPPRRSDVNNQGWTKPTYIDDDPAMTAAMLARGWRNWAPTSEPSPDRPGAPPG